MMMMMMMKRVAFMIVLLALLAAPEAEAEAFRSARGLSLHRQPSTTTPTRRKSDVSRKTTTTSQKDATSLIRGGGDEPKGGQASMTAMVFNLVNNVAGKTETRAIVPVLIMLLLLTPLLVESRPMEAHDVPLLYSLLCFLFWKCHYRCRYSFAIGGTGQGHWLDPIRIDVCGAWVDFGTYLCHGGGGLRHAGRSRLQGMYDGTCCSFVGKMQCSFQPVAKKACSRERLLLIQPTLSLPFSPSQGLWAKTIGPKSTWVVDTMIAILCLACSVIYSGIIGDAFTPLLEKAGFPAAWNDRRSNMLAITLTFLFPMSLIRNLSALAFTSILGFCAIMYTVVFINVRALDGSYALGSGKFVTDGILTVLPSFERSSLWKIDFSSLVLASNLGLAYVAHYNSPTMYRELKDTNAKRYATMVNIAFSILVFLYVITMAAGYSTFGDSTMGNILLNYHPKDILGVMGQVATGFSILFGFPLVAAGARESLIGAAAGLGFPQFGAPHNHFRLVAAMITLVTAVSVNVTDVSLAVGLTGAALGSFICYVCPAMLYVKAVEICQGKNSVAYRAARWNKALVPFGIFIGAMGVLITIRSAVDGQGI